MAKPTAFKGKRLDPLLASSLQQATGAVTEADLAILASVVATKANETAVVHNTGDEDIEGVKTFSDDMKIAPETKGLILIDRTTDAEFRLFVNSGVLGIEAV